MNKEEILKNIKEAEEKLEEAKKQLEEYENQEYGLWKPENNEDYYFIDGEGIILSDTWLHSEYDIQRQQIGNVFKTKAEAEKEIERLKVHTMLKDIALRLNKGEKIDWENSNQNKCYLYYCFDEKSIDILSVSMLKDECIYCLDENFKDVAIEEIGYERLANYLKG